MGVTKAAVLLIIATFAQAQWTPDPFCPYPSYEVTRYPYYGNCSVFWECFDGTKYVMECPSGLEFNAPLQQCDTPSLANCDPFAPTTRNPNPPTYSTNPGPVPTRDPMCPYPSEELVYFPYPGDCTKYWECFEGNKYLYTCPPGLWWHEQISECDYPGDFCDGSTGAPTTKPTSKPTVKPTQAPDVDCPYPSEQLIYYPYPGDCTKYWECFEGNKYLYTCPPGLWWHQQISECDYPGDFCDETTLPTSKPTQRPTQGPQPDCSSSSDEIVYFPYPGDCTKYWECFQGATYLYTCPEGLWWHQEATKCDNPGAFCTN